MNISDAAGVTIVLLTDITVVCITKSAQEDSIAVIPVTAIQVAAAEAVTPVIPAVVSEPPGAIPEKQPPVVTVVGQHPAAVPEKQPPIVTATGLIPAVDNKL